MFAKSLTVAALLSSVVIGCDDPEVAGKVASVLEHGAVRAKAQCYTPSAVTFCSSGHYASFRAMLLQDGSSTFSYATGGATQFSFNDLSEPVGIRPTSFGNSDGLVELSEGTLSFDFVCSAVHTTQYIDVNSDMTCTGFNLEAFGIDP